MRRNFGTLFAALLAGTVFFSAHARADTLLGIGKTVQTFYYNGVFASPEGQIDMATGNSLPSSLASPVDFLQGAASGVTITVGAAPTFTQIVITNVLGPTFPFCFAGGVGTACTDVIDGFDFKFTGENILGVSVDSASAAAFLPVSGSFQGNTHNGLQLLSNNEIQVDVTGDAPSVNDQLILDLSFAPIISTTPLPPTFPLFVSGLGALGLLGWRRKRKAQVPA
jgi:hypothetical protein